MATQNWYRHSCLTYLVGTMFPAMIAADPATLDAVTDDPFSTAFKRENARIAYVRGGDDTQDLTKGAPGAIIVNEGSILIRLYAAKTATEGVSKALERLIADTRDRIITSIKADAFRDLDPEVEIVGCSIIDDPVFSHERDLSAATLELTIRSP